MRLIDADTGDDEGERRGGGGGGGGPDRMGWLSTERLIEIAMPCRSGTKVKKNTGLWGVVGLVRSYEFEPVYRPAYLPTLRGASQYKACLGRMKRMAGQ